MQSKLKIQVGKSTSISKIERRERQNVFEAEVENEVENDSLELMDDEQLLGNHETSFFNYLVHICARLILYFYIYLIPIINSVDYASNFTKNSKMIDKDNKTFVHSKDKKLKQYVPTINRPIEKNKNKANNDVTFNNSSEDEIQHNFTQGNY